MCGSKHFEINNEKSKRCENCGFVYYANPSSATAAFIVNDKNELLVVRRGKEPAKGTLDLPGGFVDMDETAEEGMKREIKEEVYQQLKEEIYEKMIAEMRDKLYSTLSEELTATVKTYIDEEILPRIKQEISDELRQQLYDHLYDALFKALYDELYRPDDDDDNVFLPMI